MKHLGHARCNIIYSFSLLVRVRYIDKNALCPLFYVSCVNKLYYSGDEPIIHCINVLGEVICSQNVYFVCPIRWGPWLRTWACMWLVNFTDLFGLKVFMPSSLYWLWSC